MTIAGNFHTFQSQLCFEQSWTHVLVIRPGSTAGNSIAQSRFHIALFSDSKVVLDISISLIAVPMEYLQSGVFFRALEEV